MFSDDYSQLEGYVADADLDLGCGLPTEFAGINRGDTVVDLGSGAGNDVFVARQLTGDEGCVIGIDMTPEMITLANENKEKFGFSNIEFRLGEIEHLPLENQSANVVISNCVLNLVPDKRRAFMEIFRILKPQGHVCISDVVRAGQLPEPLKKSAKVYAGCIAGALAEEEYLAIMKSAGLSNIEIKRKKKIVLPPSLLKRYLDKSEIDRLDINASGIFSITVVGYKR